MKIGVVRARGICKEPRCQKHVDVCPYSPPLTLHRRHTGVPRSNRQRATSVLSTIQHFSVASALSCVEGGLILSIRNARQPLFAPLS